MPRPAANRKVASETTSASSGVEPSGKVAMGDLGEGVVGGTAPAVLHVLGEPPLEVCHVATRVLRPVDVAQHRRVERVAEFGVVALGHPEDVGDRERGVRLGIAVHELAATLHEERVDLPVGQPPEELLVLPEASRGDEAREQVTVPLVLRRIERDDVVAERIEVAIPLDQLGDVVAAGLDRQPRQRAPDGVAARVRIVVAHHLNGLCVARDGHHVACGVVVHRALAPQPVEVRVGVVDDRGLGEVVDGIEVATHSISLLIRCHRSSSDPPTFHRRFASGCATAPGRGHSCSAAPGVALVKCIRERSVAASDSGRFAATRWPEYIRCG